MPAEKGTVTVVMSTTDYDHKVTAILSTDTYSLSRNARLPTSSGLSTTLKPSSTPTYCHLKPSASSCPRFFSQPKIHKPDVPLRPIVASRGSPTYNTARHLTKILHPLVGLTPHHITNSSQFVDIIKDLKLSQSDILVSFDVVSLFTNVSTKEACLIVKERLQADPAITDSTSLTPEQVHELLLTCVSSSCFRWRDQFFEQTSVRGRVWTGHHQERWSSPQPLAPLCWRYLCGLASRQDGTSRIPPPLEQPASTHQIHHRARGEQHHLLPGCSSHTQSRWHRPHSTPQAYTHRSVSIHSSSFHHPRFKSAVHNTLVRPAFSTCDQHSLKQELHHIKTSLQLNGYKHFSFNQPKPSLPPEERPQFKSTITLPYIGHTSHKLQRIFSQAQVKIFHTAPNKIQASLQTHKDKQDT